MPPAFAASGGSSTSHRSSTVSRSPAPVIRSSASAAAATISSSLCVRQLISGASESTCPHRPMLRNRRAEGPTFAALSSRSPSDARPTRPSRTSARAARSGDEGESTMARRRPTVGPCWRRSRASIAASTTSSSERVAHRCSRCAIASSGGSEVASARATRCATLASSWRYSRRTTSSDVRPRAWSTSSPSAMCSGRSLLARSAMASSIAGLGASQKPSNHPGSSLWSALFERRHRRSDSVTPGDAPERERYRESASSALSSSRVVGGAITIGGADGSVSWATASTMTCARSGRRCKK